MCTNSVFTYLMGIFSVIIFRYFEFCGYVSSTKMVVLETVRAEDFVEYFIFPQLGDISDADIVTFLKNQCNVVNVAIEPYVKEYIWHKDEFKIFPEQANVIPGSKNYVPPHLHGITHYGDNIEDEWFIVFLLFEISKIIEDVVIRVIDADGEFLLIEAAEFLPRWLESNSGDKRAYIHRGQLYIIPPISKFKVDVSIEDAVEKVRSGGGEVIKADSSIMDTIFRRIGAYPEKINHLQHQARAYIPAKLAALLALKPSLIAPATLAFCNRDAIDMRSCREMKHFPPVDRVLRLVKFSKCLYAMMSQQTCLPAKRSYWTMPDDTKDECFKEYLLGYKITCGFEILVTQNKKPDKDTFDFSVDKLWHEYVEVLKKKGYFKNYGPGSKEYKELEEKAKQYYVTNIDSSLLEQNSASVVLKLLEGLNYNVEELKKEEQNIPPSDDESWLNVSQEGFDRILEQRFGFKQGAVNASNEPEALSNALNKFFNDISDLDGIEVPDKCAKESTNSLDDMQWNSDTEDASDSGTDDDDDDEEENTEGAGENLVTFNSDAFWNFIQHTAGSGKIRSENADTFKSYFEQMDEELASSTLAESFVKKPVQELNEAKSKSIVDENLNALENLKLSLEEQMAGPGPTSTLLSAAGVKLDIKNPKNSS